MATKRRKVRRPIGVIAPNRLYTTEGVMRFAGLGHESLAEARRSGRIKPYEVGRRVFYLGKDIIAWITEGSRG